MSTTTTAPAATGHEIVDPHPQTSRLWALAGLGAALGGIATVAFSGLNSAVYDPALTGNAQGQAEALAAHRGSMIGLHLALAAVLVLSPVFAAGVHRRLAGRLPAGSLLPAVAASGMGLVAVAALLGSGLDTEFIFAPADDVPESLVFYGHWVGTVPWLWVGAGLTALAIAVASLRHGATSRWIGWFSLVLGVVTTGFGISPLQYMAGFTGPVWLLVVALGFAYSPQDRRPTGR